jgi:mannose-6-phosphate isomerase-like protein (cupin superfamily)
LTTLEEASAMPVIDSRQHLNHEIPGASFQTLASPTLGSRETSVWRLRLEPWSPGLPHRLTREEIFVVLSGRATAILDGSCEHLSAGCALVVPAGVDFSLATGEEACEAIVCFPVGGQGIVAGGEPFTPPWAA